MSEPNRTPSISELPQYLIGDLGPAQRHVLRLINHELPASLQVLKEIQDSLARCVERIRRDWHAIDAMQAALTPLAERWADTPVWHTMSPDDSAWYGEIHITVRALKQAHDALHALET